MNFADWVLSEVKKHQTSTYDQYWRKYFDELEPKRSKHWSFWFPEKSNRIVIPITVPGSLHGGSYEHNNMKKQVDDVLIRAGYQIIDWQKGTVKTPDNQTTDVARALYKVGARNLRTEYLHWLEGRYGGVRYNEGDNHYLMILSQDAHDIATQSTGKMWTSCNTLPLDVSNWTDDQFRDNYTFKKLADEVLDGGIIAYICHVDDPQCKRPLGRINAKRYENPVTQENIVFCSDDRLILYGKGVLAFFINYLRDWLEKKQNISQLFGDFQEKGGKWIEANPDQFEFRAKEWSPSLEKQIVQHYVYYNKDEYKADKFLSIALGMIEDQNHWTVSENFWKWLKKLVFQDNRRYNIDSYMLRNLFKKFPDKISPGDLMRLNEKTIKGIFQTGLFDRRSDMQEIRDRYLAYQESLLKQILSHPFKNNNFLVLNRILEQGLVEIRDPYWTPVYHYLTKAFEQFPDLRENIIKHLFYCVPWDFKNSEVYQRNIADFLEKYRTELPEHSLWVSMYLNNLKREGKPLPKGFENDL